MPESVTIIDNDDANLYLRETLSQILFLMQKGDINETQAFGLFFEQPIAKALLIGNLEDAIPVSCFFDSFLEKAASYNCLFT